MIIYVLRHGQTNYNLEGKFQGQVDVPLNALGIAQAKEVGKSLFNVQFNLVFSSPLTRALQTARYATNQNIIEDNRIIERSFGLLEGKKSINDYEEKTEQYHIESIEVLRKRVHDFMDELLKKYSTLSNILIVTHACVATMIESYMNNIDYRDLEKNFKIKNGEYKKYNVIV